jgi:hypothetical protein
MYMKMDIVGIMAMRKFVYLTRATQFPEDNRAGEASASLHGYLKV